ncbi:GntR family transcriptional regulator [Rufibacter ruber]|uniref:GntR family transcriptional regulator n=1 Tax=Rufibacter ruber TaxID=1783499 RepID=UPI00082A07CB|nr:GntR family transcriptional regulator [Rufibacter ruber]
MSPDQILSCLSIDPYAATPKYQQVTSAIQAAIEKGQIRKGDVLPSLNELTYSLDISRDTAEKAYKALKQMGVLGSVPGKGYYIENTQLQQNLKVFLLFNKLSAHKKIIYDAFVEALGPETHVDFYIYNNDYALFKKMLARRKEEYTHYVIIPHFVEGGEQAHEVINLLPKEKLVLLDKKLPGVTGHFAAVYENFEQDIYGALAQVAEELRKYRVLKLVFPHHSYFPAEIVTGFERFCRQYHFAYQVLPQVQVAEIQEGDVFINLVEGDLVALLQGILAEGLEVGRQVGVISYNETPLKRFILNGITTISTDFQKMGALAAQLILQHSRQHLEVPFSIIKRASI